MINSIETNNVSQEDVLEILLDLSTDIITIDNSDDLFWHVVYNVVGRLNFVDCVIYNLSHDGLTLRQKAAIGPKSPKKKILINPISININDGIVGKVARNKTAYISGDVTKEDAYVSDIEFSGSEICVPIMCKGKVYGVIDSEHPTKNFFGSNHLKILSKIADLVGAKIQQLELDKSNHFHSIILEQVMDVVAFTNQNNNIVYMNPAASTEYKYTMEQLEGMNVGELIEFEGVDGEQAIAIRKSLEEKQTWAGSLKIKRGDGTTGIFDVRLQQVFDDEGKSLGNISVSRDISDRVENEKNLLAKTNELTQVCADLELANKTQMTFLANASHELRTPLNAIIGFSELLKSEDTRKIAKEKFAEYGSDINAAGVHLSELVSDLLDIAKVESGEVEAYPEEVQVESTIRSCLTMMKDRIETANLTVNISANNDLPPALIDKRHFMQVILNLLDNAVKHSRNDSEIIEIYCEAMDDDKLRVDIKDYGVGISPEWLERVFLPFESHQEHIANPKGTGLGLALSKKLLEVNNGRIRVYSELNKGSTFSFTCPLLVN